MTEIFALLVVCVAIVWFGAFILSVALLLLALLLSPFAFLRGMFTPGRRVLRVRARRAS